MKTLKVLLFALILMFVSNTVINAQQNTPTPVSKVTKQTILWYSDDPMVAERVALMYTGVAKTYKLFEDVSVIVWGPSAKLVTENKEIQAKLKEMMGEGISINACVTCANM